MIVPTKHKTDICCGEGDYVSERKIVRRELGETGWMKQRIKFLKIGKLA